LEIIGINEVNITDNPKIVPKSSSFINEFVKTSISNKISNNNTTEAQISENKESIY